MQSVHIIYLATAELMISSYALEDLMAPKKHHPIWGRGFWRLFHSFLRDHNCNGCDQPLSVSQADTLMWFLL